MVISLYLVITTVPRMTFSHNSLYNYSSFDHIITPTHNYHRNRHTDQDFKREWRRLPHFSIRYQSGKLCIISCIKNFNYAIHFFRATINICVGNYLEHLVHRAIGLEYVCPFLCLIGTCDQTVLE